MMAGQSSVASRACMTEEEQDERRKQIRDIMKDDNLSQLEKSRAIQMLMDGRRRSSCASRASSVCSDHEGEMNNYVTSMASAAAIAADFCSSDEEGDALMADSNNEFATTTTTCTTSPRGPASDINDYRDRGGGGDQYSVASEITHSSHHTGAISLPPGTTYRQIHGRSFSLHDWTDNERVAAAAQTSIFSNNPAVVSRLMEQSRPPCQHYERNCTIISPCCGLAFGCRICHDECSVLPAPLNLRSQGQEDQRMLGDLARSNNKGKPPERRRSMPLMGAECDEESHHPIDRFAIKEVICRKCYTRQSSKTNNCVSCGVRFGSYHCSICNLWMSGKDNPYHCEHCGFCRVGGRENFKHCHDCGMCIDTILFDGHNCKSGKYMSNCPICQEDLFSSRHASHEMPCGHAIHWHCFKELTSFDTRCPVCKKTAETPEQMASTWSAIAMGISLQPLPEEMARVVNIMCNDCERRDENRRWHFLGVRCNSCMSFNTNVEQIVLNGRDAAVFLDRLEANNANVAGVPASIITQASATSNDLMDEDMPGAQETSSGSSHDTNYFPPF